MSTLPITDAFGAYLTDERHFSPYTARCYGADLRQFVEFLGAQNSISPDAAKETEALRKREAQIEAAGGHKPPAGDVAGTISPSTVTRIICQATPDTIRGFLAHL